MEVAIDMEIMSTEMIKPSKPTPPHLKSYKLSLLDQVSLCEYSNPLAFFYTAPRGCNNDEGTGIITRLKESLSKTLTFYYPLAGRSFPQESTIICNDAGVPLVVAHANCTLSSFLTCFNRVNLVPEFIPRDVSFIDPTRIMVDGLVQAAFQITVFKCGGFALGSHGLSKGLDGVAWYQFFATWAATATGGGPQLSDFEARDLTIQTCIFPPVPSGDVPPLRTPPVLQPVEDGSGGTVVKSFVFTPASISKLQAIARSDSVPNPTRIESVTCFLWKHLMAAAAAVAVAATDTATTIDQSSSSHTARQERARMPTVAIHSVNIRPHLRPKLPLTSIGMFAIEAVANSRNEEGGMQTLKKLVVSLRQALSKTKDSEWLNKFQGDERMKVAFQHRKTITEISESYFFTSLKGFDQLDFGSRVPVWIGLTGGRPSSYFRNFIPLIHTSGHQIEAWPILDETIMKVLESDQEFLAYVIPSGVAPVTFLP